MFLFACTKSFTILPACELVAALAFPLLASSIALSNFDCAIAFALLATCSLANAAAGATDAPPRTSFRLYNGDDDDADGSGQNFLQSTAAALEISALLFHQLKLWMT